MRGRLRIRVQVGMLLLDVRILSRIRGVGVRVRGKE